MNDSVLFVDEYIDLEAPTRSNTILVKKEQSQIEEAAATIVVKTEPVQEEQVESAEANDEPQDIKPVVSAIVMPDAMVSIKNEIGDGNESCEQSE